MHFVRKLAGPRLAIYKHVNMLKHMAHLVKLTNTIAPVQNWKLLQAAAARGLWAEDMQRRGMGLVAKCYAGGKLWPSGLGRGALPSYVAVGSKQVRQVRCLHGGSAVVWRL